MKKIFTVLLLVGLLVSCSNINKEQLATIQISNLENVVDLDDGYMDVKNVKVVPLEYTDESMLGNGVRIFSSGEFLFVYDLKNIYLFDKYSGEFKSVISHHGKSDQEYLSIFGATADDKAREVYVLDINGKKINVYNYDGDFVRQTKSDTILTFDKIGDNRFVGYNGGVIKKIDNHFNLSLYDKEFNFIKGLDRRTEADINVRGYLKIKNCMLYGGGSYNYLRDTVFSVTTDGLSPLLVIDKGVYKLPDELADNSEECDKYIVFDSPMLLGDYLLYRTFIPSSNQHRLDLWDLKSNELLFRHNSSTKERKDGIPIKYEGEVIYPRIMYVDENDRVYCLLPTESVVRAGINNNDNPVIISYELE